MMTREEAAEAIEVLLAAKDRILDGWTQGAYARNAAGESVYADNPEAVAWCARGAVLADIRTRAYGAALDVLDGATPVSVALFNDDWPTTTKEQVVSLFDDAVRTFKDRL
jgi:hypothetical protein